MNAKTHKEQFWRVNNPIVWGLAATVSVVLISVVLAFMPSCLEADCISKWQAFKFATPNEVGDTLAGIAGSLAFVWIIATVWLQSQELAAQRQELQLNRKESAKMANALAAQADIFKDEQKQRHQLRAKELLEEQLNGLYSKIALSRSVTKKWGFYYSYQEYSQEPDGQPTTHNIEGDATIRLFKDVQDRSRDAYIKASCAHAMQARETLESFIDTVEPINDSIGAYSDIHDACLEIEDMIPSLADDQALRIKNLRIPELKVTVFEVLNMDIWIQSENSGSDQ